MPRQQITTIARSQGRRPRRRPNRSPRHAPGPGKPGAPPCQIWQQASAHRFDGVPSVTQLHVSPLPSTDSPEAPSSNILANIVLGT